MTNKIIEGLSEAIEHAKGVTHDAETVERVGNAALEHMFDRRGVRQVFEAIRDEDPDIWREIVLETGESALSALPPQEVTGLLDPDMPDDQMRLHAGEITAQEIRTARAFIRLANAKARSPMSVKDAAKVLLDSHPHGSWPSDAFNAVVDHWENPDRVITEALRAISEGE